MNHHYNRPRDLEIGRRGGRDLDWKITQEARFCANCQHATLLEQTPLGHRLGCLHREAIAKVKAKGAVPIATARSDNGACKAAAHLWAKKL